MTKEEHIQRLKDDPIYVVMGEEPTSPLWSMNLGP